VQLTPVLSNGTFTVVEVEGAGTKAIGAPQALFWLVVGAVEHGPTIW
jgi:hypothetical protein